MGGEFGPPVVVPALIDCLHRSTSTEALLYGDQQAIEKQLADCENASVLSRLTVIHCSEIITDSDKPSVAVRSKREASMGRAVKAVADQNADACISAGNTGALMALGLFNLKTLPGISRPAI